MADLLPSSPDPAAGDGTDPRVIGVDSEEADDLLGALQSETARDILAALYEDPATPSALASDLDTSIQNVRYHLERLTEADLVEVADTIYSEKGREMDVYAPAAKPLVVFAGDDEDTTGVEAALSRLLGALGVLGLGSLAVQRLFGSRYGGDATESGEPAFQGRSAGETTTEADVEVVSEADNATAGSGAATTDTEGTEVMTDGAAETTRTVTEQAAEATTTVADAGADAGTAAIGTVPPGAVFFAGGLVVLLALGAVWYLSDR